MDNTIQAIDFDLHCMLFHSIITITNVLSTLQRVQPDFAAPVPHGIRHPICSVPKGLALVSTNHDSCL